ncbi:single-stranded DNA-binding protein [Absicoccus porci]|uniref:Single-stranded DNA-binding protein n=1 Tax=Absicoccus porci TaxID=2486576 RepID=A0A3N0I295_9FIRM|nr:single-stranded DNA-binding protein [Absicoccus porci]RNM30686.1 single-stranded DNA-binding protein [Absicoccus porci]
MINRIVLTGRLTKDPEPRTTKTGKTYVSFALAVDRSRKVEGQPEADFINCVAWNRQAEAMAQYLHRGSLIGIDGRLLSKHPFDVLMWRFAPDLPEEWDI